MAIIEHYGEYDTPAEFPEHFHTSCELMYIHEGCLELVSVENKFTLNGGMLYLVPSCIRHTTRLIDKAIYRRTLVMINPWEYSRVHYSMPLNNILMGLTCTKPIAAVDDFGAKEYLEKINAGLSSDDILQKEIQAAFITIIISEMIKRTDFVGKNIKEPDKLIQDVQRYIREHSSEQLMISDIAERFYISKFYLAHRFSEQTGMSPRQFLNCIRLSDAYSLLHDKELKISEISERCGFASPSDMTKRFLSHYGITPSEFRRKLIEKSKNNIVFRQ